MKKYLQYLYRLSPDLVNITLAQKHKVYIDLVLIMSDKLGPLDMSIYKYEHLISILNDKGEPYISAINSESQHFSMLSFYSNYLLENGMVEIKQDITSVAISIDQFNIKILADLE